MPWRGVGAVVVLALAVGCSSDDGEGAAPTAATAAPASTTAPTTSTATTVLRHRETVEALADDALAGRDNGTPGSELAQSYLVGELEAFAEPVAGRYLHPFDGGRNILAVVPGTDLADEYVVLGAHYDHLGTACRSADPADDICNGAGDNAAGVAVVLEVGRRLAAGEPPRRSVVLALWDAEEDGLLGSSAYMAAPPVPLADTLAYLNWDIQGVNLVPSLAGATVVVGAETGGAPLVDAVRTAGSTSSSLDLVDLSLVFGQGRSDHAVFAAAGVPTAFFTDSSSGCYHTAQDEIDVVDMEKLGEQIAIGEALARHLVSTDDVPTPVTDPPLATFADAEALLDLVRRAQADLGLLAIDDQRRAAQLLADLEAMVSAGPRAFDGDDIGALLASAAAVVDVLTRSGCG